MGVKERYNRDNILFGYLSKYNYKDKEKNINNHITTVLNRTSQIFIYTGLPETVPAWYLEYLLQVNGFACVTEFKGELYAFYGGLGGEPDYNYQPTICTISNPALNYSANLKIGIDCVILKNDNFYQGLIPIISKYCTLINESEISLNVLNILHRQPTVLKSTNDNDFEKAKKFLEDVEGGKLAVLPSTTSLLNGVEFNPWSTNSSENAITKIIEYQQFLKANLYNELGLQLNYNMKRENLNENEINSNEDILQPLIDCMLENRKNGIELINKLYDTNISVELYSSWRDNVMENDNSENDNLNNENNISEEGENNETA